MRELTLEITNFCEQECIFCSSCSTPEGGYLSYEEIESFLVSNYKMNDLDIINISGGEPLSNPDFYKIQKLAKKYAKKVVIYTNEIENIKYNTSVLKEISVEANVCLYPGSNVYIPKNASKVNLLKFVSQGRGKDNKEINTYLSGHNCEKCDHIVLQANSKIAQAPCKKKY